MHESPSVASGGRQACRPTPGPTTARMAEPSAGRLALRPAPAARSEAAPPPAALALSPPAVGVVYNAERLNGLAGRHWQRFSRQNYFDSQGIFASALLSGPLLLIMFVQLVGAGRGAAGRASGGDWQGAGAGRAGTCAA